MAAPGDGARVTADNADVVNPRALAADRGDARWGQHLKNIEWASDHVSIEPEQARKLFNQMIIDPRTNKSHAYRINRTEVPFIISVRVLNVVNEDDTRMTQGMLEITFDCPYLAIRSW